MIPTPQDAELGAVFPVLPSYTATGELDLARTASYARFLYEHGAGTVMTTAGTTQFNLLSTSEISELNACVVSAFPKRAILGAPASHEAALIPFLANVGSRWPKAELLISYPERLYAPTEVVAFFHRIDRALGGSRIHIHALPIRAGRGLGSVDFTGEMTLAIIDSAPHVVGMKEECSTYEAGFELCATVSATRNFEFIVAGGSMRRFLLLQAAGARSFFAGVGSLFPEVEIAFFKHVSLGRLREASSIISQIETPLFAVFMAIGWHKALRYAAKRLNLIGEGERLPMTGLSDVDAKRVEAALDDAQRNITMLREADVL
jgi:dihydrodipicolinate synthase/N-acetylneuraminate lyase